MPIGCNQKLLCNHWNATGRVVLYSVWCEFETGMFLSVLSWLSHYSRIVS